MSYLTTIPNWILFHFLLYSSSLAQPFYEVLISHPPDLSSQSLYGQSSAIHGDNMIVGAFYESKDATGEDSLYRAGAAYLLTRDLWGSWQHSQKLTANKREQLSLFGFSVDIDEEYAIISGPAFTSIHFAADDTFGVCYIFKETTNGEWEQTSLFTTADHTEYANFADLVAISGRYAIVSAHTQHSSLNSPNNGNNANGAVYVFERDSTSEVWIEVAKLEVPDDSASENYFGSAIDILDNYILVGAYKEDEDSQNLNYQEDAGAAYLFERDNSGTWIQRQKIVAPNRIGSKFFGKSIAIDGDQLLIGSTSWTQYDSAGNVSFNSGVVYVYEQDSIGQWVSVQIIIPSDHQQGDAFGNTLSAKNGSMIVGAYLDDDDLGPDQGSIYLFERQASGQWVEIQKIFENGGGIEKKIWSEWTSNRWAFSCGIFKGQISRESCYSL